MKNICLFTLTIIALLYGNTTHASQWQQLNGPYGNVSTVLGKHNGYLYTSNNYNQLYNGIYRSNNSGNNWTDVTTGITTPYANAFATIGSDLFTCSDTSVYMSTNNGGLWTDVSNNLPVWSFVRNLVAHNNILFADVYNSAGYDEVYYSNNNGSTWNSTGFIMSNLNQFYSTGNSLWICGTNGAIYVSTDNGQTFNIKANNIPFSANVTAIGGVGDTMYCGANNYIYMTTDGGNLWMPQTNGVPTQVNVMDICINGNTVFAGTLNDGVLTSTIGGSSWLAFGTGLPNYSSAYAVEIIGTEIFIASYDGVYQNNLTGGTWNLKNNGLNRALIRSLYSEGNLVLATAGLYQGLKYSTDAGNTWSSTNITNNSHISWIKKIGITYWCGSNLGGLYYSPDGISWTMVPLFYNATWGIIAYGNSLMVAADNGVQVSTNNGSSWTLMNNGLPANPQAWRILNMGQYVYVMINGKGIYRSDDGGNNWESYNQNLTQFNSVTDFYKAGDFLVVEKFTGRMRRLQTDSIWNLVLSNVLSAYVYESNDGIIYSGTSQGIFISDDIGETWHAWNEGFNPQIVNEWRKIAFDGNTVFGGSMGFGIWKRNFFPEIITQAVNSGPYCPGNTFTVNYSSALTFNTGNKFIVQLSDSSGYFINNPVRLDSVTSITPQAITVTIPAGLKASSLYRIRVIATDPYVVVQDCNCAITINQLPAISLQPANQNPCEGNNSGFFVGATGSNLNYQWQVNTGTGWSNLLNNSTYQNVNDALLLINNVTTGMSGYQYRCIITASCGLPLNSNAATLNVNALPLITQQPVNDTICEFSSTAFSCLATGGVITYRWQYDNGSGFFTDVPNVAPFSNVTSATMQITNINAVYDGYKFRCKIGNSCTFSNVATLTINGTPVSQSIGLNIQVCDGAPVNIGVSVSGAGITYQWQENSGSGFVNLTNGSNYSGVNQAVLNINAFTAPMNGYQYQCIINGVCVPFNSTSVASTVTIINNATTIIQQPQNINVCEGSSAYFTTQATGGFVFYQWQMNDGNGWVPLSDLYPYSGTSTDTLHIDTAGFSLNGYQYRCVAGGCTTSNAATLTVMSLPNVSLNQFPSGFCFNDPNVNLNGGLPAGGTYFGNGVYNNLFMPSVAGLGNASIIYVYTNSSGCTNTAGQIFNVSNCIGTGISVTDVLTESLVIYPNPASDIINIRLKNTPVNSLVVRIYNSTGLLVSEKKVDARDNFITIHTEFLSNGLYLISVFNQNEVSSKRLIISR